MKFSRKTAKNLLMFFALSLPFLAILAISFTYQNASDSASFNNLLADNFTNAYMSLFADGMYEFYRDLTAVFKISVPTNAVLGIIYYYPLYAFLVECVSVIFNLLTFFFKIINDWSERIGGTDL